MVDVNYLKVAMEDYVVADENRQKLILPVSSDTDQIIGTGLDRSICSWEESQLFSKLKNIV